jgi:hypothetical protein
VSTDTDKDRRFLTFRNPFGDPVDDDATAVVDYPEGYTASDFDENGKHFLITTMFGRLLSDNDDFTVAFGASSATITNTSGHDWPGSMICVLELDLLGNTDEPLAVEDGGTGVRRLADFASALGGVRVLSFGDLSTGNDTDVVRAAHEYANEYGYPVSYAGISQVSIDFDAEIPIATDVDFAGCVIKAVGGLKSGTSYDPSDADIMFIIADDATPLVTGTNALSSGNRALLGDTPTSDFFTGPGYCYMQGDTGSTEVVADRTQSSATTYTYKQAFKVTGRSYAAFPLARDLSGTTSVYYRYRFNTGKGWLTIKNAVFDLSTVTNQTFFSVQRNEVQIENISLAGWASIPAYAANALIAAADCSDLVIRDYNGMPASNSPLGSGYMIYLNKVASAYLERVKARGGWGIMGNFHVSGLFVNDCELNRVDSHEGLFNCFVSGTTIHEHGIIYGWGGGVLEVRDCTFINCPAIRHRDDYSGAWYSGGFTVNGATLINTAFEAVVVDLATSEVGSAGAITPLPEYIRISGVSRTNRAGTVDANAQISGVKISVYADGLDVVSPNDISISDITSPMRWQFHNEIPILDMQQYSTSRMMVNISDVKARNKVTAVTRASFLVPAAAKTVPPANPITASVVASDVLNFSVEAPTGDIEVTVDGGSVNRIKTASGRRVMIRGAALIDDAFFGSETAAPIGSGYGSATRYVSLIGCNVHGTYDLSAAQLLSGVAIPNSQSVTLPGGATTTTAVTGWIGGSF